jgi:anti-sigma regulatory factor (Ser/Thr protein kinase)
VLVRSAEFPRSLDSAAEARAFAQRALRDWGYDELGDVVQLLVSELVANAVSHAESATTLSLRLSDDILRVEVHDASPAVPHRRVVLQDDPDGRGLFIVDAMATRWGVESHAAGKSVWFEVPLPAAR